MKLNRVVGMPGVSVLVASVVLLAGCGSTQGAIDAPGLDTGVARSGVNTAAAPSGVFGNVTWKSFGPVKAPGGVSGKLYAFAHDPSNPKVMYVGSANTGVYGTTDGGTSWVPLNNGIVDASGYTATGTTALTVDPSNPSTVLAATGGQIYRSADSGKDWAPVGPAKSASAFAWTGGKVYAASGAGVLVSADGGATWTVSLALPAGVSAASAVTTVGSLVVAGFSSKAPLEFLVNGAWVARGTPNGSIHRIAVDPFNTNIIYASRGGGTYDYALSASTDGGVTWVDVTYPHLGAQAIAFSVVTPHRLYYGGDGGPVNYINADGSTLPTYLSGYTAGTDKQDIIVEPNPAGTDDQCWVATDQGLFYSNTCSVNANNPGQGLTAGLENYLVTDFALTKSGTGAIVQLQDYSSTATADSGATWTRGGSFEDGAAAVNPGNDNWCYSFQNGLSRSSTGCNAFHASTPSLSGPITNPGVFAFDPTNANTMYLVSGGKVYRSVDGGATFADAGWTYTHASSVRIDPDNGTIAVVDSGLLYQSANGGTTWTTATQTGISMVEYVAGRPGVIIAVTGNSVLRSTDNGVTFSATNITNGGGFFQIACDAAPKPMCAVASNGQLLASADQGSTWERIDRNTITHKFTSVRWLNGYLYAGTYGQGIIRTTSQLVPVTVTVTNPGAQHGTVGTPTSLQIAASGSPASGILAYAATGLPAGLTINPTTGRITGTPASVGPVTVTVTATDSASAASGIATFSWTITPDVIAPRVDVPPFQADKPFTYQIHASGGTAGGYTYTFIPNSHTPRGVTMDTAGLIHANVPMNNIDISTGWTFSYQATDSAGSVAEGTVNLVLTPGGIYFRCIGTSSVQAKNCVSHNLSDPAAGGIGHVGQPWPTQVVKAGRGWSAPSGSGAGGDLFTLYKGQVPPGMWLSGTNGWYGKQYVLIGGAPTRAGTYTFQIKATDQHRGYVITYLTITVH